MGQEMISMVLASVPLVMLSSHWREAVDAVRSLREKIA